MTFIKNTAEFFEDMLNNTENKLIIISAYVTQTAFNFIMGKSKHIEQKVIVLRGRDEDFEQGATFFNIKQAINDGWQVYINFNLHAKVYVFDWKHKIIGSSNLTAMGLGLTKTGNTEWNELLKIRSGDQERVNKIIKNSFFLNERKDIKRIQDIIQDTNEEREKLEERIKGVMSLGDNSGKFYSSSKEDKPDMQIGEIDRILLKKKAKILIEQVERDISNNGEKLVKKFKEDNIDKGKYAIINLNNINHEELVNYFNYKTSKRKLYKYQEEYYVEIGGEE